MEIPNDKENDLEFKRSVSKQVTLGLLTNFSNLGPSMSLGFSAVALPFLKGILTDDQSSWFASVASLATPFGCFFSGPFADRVGRRKAIFFVNFVCISGWLTIAAACRDATKIHYPLLIAGRLLTGFSTGLCSSPATVYMVEISSSELRGVFATWASISFSLGVLLVYFLGFLLKDSLGLISLISTGFPCVGLLFAIFFVPESPVWLVRKNHIEQAKSSMCKVFGANTYNRVIQAEVDMLLQEKGVKKINETKSWTKQVVRKINYLLKPESLKPMAIATAFFFFQQFSGTFAIIFYAIDIVENAGITFEPYMTIVVIGVVRLLSAILASFLSRSVGRRPLSIVSGIGMTASLLILTGLIFLKENGTENLTELSLVMLLGYFVTSSLGFLPIPFAVTAELFPSKIRGTATGLTSGLGYVFNFAAVKVYPDIVYFFGRKGVFSCYGVVALLGTVFVVTLLPETKGKSLQEIEAYFKRKRMDIDDNNEMSLKSNYSDRVL
nr:facilitated trehalose transporter Tret1-like isoform X1 [Leptinotarsa decemlineata]